MDLKKLKNNFKFGCILLTAALFSQVQSVHAADVTITSATTSTITATGTDTITINSGGSIYQQPMLLAMLLYSEGSQV